MNSLALFAIAVAVFVFGYRFYSKLLGFGVFRLENYSTPAHAPVGDAAARFSRHLIFGHHVASLAAGVAVSGSIVSLVWGWVPAFLWVVTGSVVAAGTYGLGSLWLSLRYPGRDPAEIAERLLGAPAHGLFALVAFLLLLILNAISVLLAAQLLSAFPASVLPFGIITILALLLGNFLRGRDDFEIVPATLIVLALSLAAVWLTENYPLSFTGALFVETTDSRSRLDSTVAWVALLFVYGYQATRMPMWKLIRPRGYLTALLMGIALFIFYIGVTINHPDLVAPAFHAGPNIPATLPWLFVTLTSGALAGVHLLIANAITARTIKQETDARYFGYGGALALGLLALSAIIIASTGFADTQTWSQHYASWDEIRNLHAVLEGYINGFAQHAASLGMNAGFARSLMAVVIIGLLVSSLEAGLRAQKQLLTSLSERHPAFFPEKEKALIATAVGLSALLALHDGAGRGGLLLWPLFGVADQLFAVSGFVLLMLMLRSLARPVALVLLPLIFLLVTTNVALGLLLSQWWTSQNWLLFALGMLLALIEAIIAILTFKTLKSRPLT